MRVVAIIQARMGSTRLPGKVLMDLAGEPMLARVVHRVQRAHTVQAVVVATTTADADGAITTLCAGRGWPYERGSEDDVLDRYYQAAVGAAADVVVRITSDCPLIDPAVIDRVVDAFHAARPAVDYASNFLERRTFPRGLDTEVMTRDALASAWREARDAASREHVTPFIYRHPDRFRLHGVENAADYSHLRWTVDTPDDLELIRRIYGHFRHDQFSWHEVLALLERHPDWLALNRDVPQKAVS